MSQENLDQIVTATTRSESQPQSIQPNIDHQDFHRLSPQFIPFERRTSYVGAVVISCILVAVTSPSLLLAWERPWLGILILLCWAAIAAVLFLSAHFWPPIHFRHFRWRLTDQGLEIHRGVWWKHRIAVPTARVQHVDVSQGPIQRMFELGKLTVHTAGTKNASVDLDGLEHSQALRLRDELIAQKESLDVT